MVGGPIVRTSHAYVPRDFEEGFFQKARIGLGFDALLALSYNGAERPPFLSVFPSLPSYPALELDIGSRNLELLSLTPALSVQMDSNLECIKNYVSHFFIFSLFPLVESYDTFYPGATVDWITEDILSKVRSLH